MYIVIVKKLLWINQISTPSFTSTFLFVSLNLFLVQVVTACAVLHNICVGVGDELPVEDGAMEGDDPPLEEECGTEPQSGAPWRAALANAITPLEVAPQDHDYFVLVNMINMTTNIGMSTDRVTDSVLT